MGRCVRTGTHFPDLGAMKTLARLCSFAPLLAAIVVGAPLACSSNVSPGALEASQCGSLSSCCAAMGSEAEMSACENVVVTGDDATCTSALLNYTSIGACTVDAPADGGHLLGADTGLPCQSTGTCTTPNDAGHPTGLDTGTTPTIDGGGIVDGDAWNEDTGNGCNLGLTSCSGICTDTTSDPDNCGACDNVCSAGVCTASVCGGSGGCTGSETSCDGLCTDTTTDPDNCGVCGNQCPGGGTCAASTCSSAVGGCGHSPCAVGAALSDTCDPYADGTTAAVCDCDGDTACCTTSWDSQCVEEAQAYCDSVGGCEDPQCPAS